MKKNARKHLYKTIQKNAISFLAVAFIAAISIAIYIGLQSAATATLQAADTYFKENRLSNFEVYATQGITEEDIQKLENLQDIRYVEGGYTTPVSIQQDGQFVLVHAISLTEQVNIPIVLKGALPTQENEVAIEQKLAKESGMDVGDTIVLSDQGLLKNDRFTVTAIINRPEYCCAKFADVRGTTNVGLGSLSYYMCFSKTAFMREALGGRFTKAYIKADSLDTYYYYSEEYTEQEEILRDKLRSALGDEGQYVLATRNDMGDLRAMRILVDSIYGLSYVMSMIFVLVAIIVCYAAVSRMIFEQRGLIGTQKALGFTVGEVLRHFMLYTILCALLGILLGILIGVGIVECIVIYIFSGEFLLPKIPIIVPGVHIAIAAVVCVVIFIATSYFAGIKLLRQPAIALLRYEIKSRKKPFFFEKLGFYKKLSLYSRSMIKNVLNDTERMITTIMGVVGCIAMLIICFSLKMGIENSSVKQFAAYFLYNHRLVVDTTAGTVDAFEKELEESPIEYLAISDKLRSFYIEEDTVESAHIVVAEDLSALQDFMVLEDINTGTKVTESAGVYISRKCAELYGLSQGDTIMLSDSFGQYHEATISGVIEHYLSYHMVVTTADYYTELTGETPDRCVYLLTGDISGLYDRISALDGFISLKDNSDSVAKADQINMVIGLCIALAAAMSVLVLLNQITMHIDRKSKELGVMRVNGYSIHETKMYVCKDNIVLTAAGLLLGSAFGAAVSYMSIRIMEGEINHYIRTINPIACMIGVGIGAAFAILINGIALRKINKLDLTSIQKD